MVPKQHPYMQTFLKYYKDFGGANTVLVALQSNNGDIYRPEFMEALRHVTDDVFFIPGVDRARVTSIFTPNILYVEVVEGRSEEHTSELQSLMRISYAVFCLKKTKNTKNNT